MLFTLEIYPRIRGGLVVHIRKTLFETSSKFLGKNFWILGSVDVVHHIYRDGVLVGCRTHRSRYGRSRRSYFATRKKDAEWIVFHPIAEGVSYIFYCRRKFGKKNIEGHFSRNNEFRQRLSCLASVLLLFLGQQQRRVYRFGKFRPVKTQCRKQLVVDADALSPVPSFFHGQIFCLANKIF